MTRRTTQPQQLPDWFPRWAAWGNSLALCLFSIATTLASRLVIRVGWLSSGFGDRPEPLLWFTALALLVPIPIIAFIHHVLYSLAGAVAPEKTAASDIGKIKGWLPNPVSWWEAITSWAILYVSLLVVLVVFLAIHPLFHLTYRRVPFSLVGNTNELATTLTIVWIVIMAILYQLENVVEKRIAAIAVADASKKERK